MPPEETKTADNDKAVEVAGPQAETAENPEDEPQEDKAVETADPDEDSNPDSSEANESDKQKEDGGDK